jgi:hypothetical protein
MRACWEQLVEMSHERWHHHQLLGHPDLSQSDMELSCHLASEGIFASEYDRLDAVAQAAIQREALTWTHLFQIRPDEYAKVSWGEYGSLALWIKRGDLEQRNFATCWARPRLVVRGGVHQASPTARYRISVGEPTPTWHGTSENTGHKCLMIRGKRRRSWAWLALFSWFACQKKKEPPRTSVRDQDQGCV